MRKLLSMVDKITFDKLLNMKNQRMTPFANAYEYIILYVDKLYSKSRDPRKMFDFDEKSAKVLAFDMLCRHYQSYFNFCSDYNVSLTQQDKRNLRRIVFNKGSDFAELGKISSSMSRNQGVDVWSVYIDDKSRTKRFKKKDSLTKTVDFREIPVWSAINEYEYMFETLMGAFYIKSDIKAKFKFRFDMLSHRLKRNLNDLNIRDVSQIKSATILPSLNDYLKSGFNIYMEAPFGRLVIQYYADVIDLISEFNGRVIIFASDKLLPWVTPRIMSILSDSKHVDFEFVHDYYQYIEKFASSNLIDALFDSSVSNFEFNHLILDDTNIDKAPKSFVSQLHRILDDLCSDISDALLVNQQYQGPWGFAQSRFKTAFDGSGRESIGEFDNREFEYFLDEGIERNWVSEGAEVHTVRDDIGAESQDSLLIIPDLFLGFIAKAMILFERNTANEWVDCFGRHDSILNYRPDTVSDSYVKVLMYFEKVLFESVYASFEANSITQLENVYVVFDLLHNSSGKSNDILKGIYTQWNSKFMNYKAMFFNNGNLDNLN